MNSLLKAKLLDNIQFIYELGLAKLELQYFVEDFSIENGFRNFNVKKLKKDISQEYLSKRLAYFKEIDGLKSDYFYLQRYNQTRSVNQYLTHWIYPYKGKFHPQMIRALINIIGLKENDTLLDPFVGSGTAVLEAQLLGINSIGIDISPLCVLISKVKTQSVNKLNEIKKYESIYSFSNSLFSKKSNPKQSDEVTNFYKVAEMIAHSDEKRRNKNFDLSLRQNIQKMIIAIENFDRATKDLNLKLGQTKIIAGDARKFPLNRETIDGIITSPPYSIALNYVANDSHALQALGYDLNKIKNEFIGVRGSGFNKFGLYEKDMEKAYSEMHRVLKKGKYCVVIIGNVTYDGQEIDTTKQVIDYCQKIGFKFVKKIDKIIYGLYNIMQKEYILIFKKG